MSRRRWSGITEAVQELAAPPHVVRPAASGSSRASVELRHVDANMMSRDLNEGPLVLLVWPPPLEVIPSSRTSWLAHVGGELLHVPLRPRGRSSACPLAQARRIV